MKAILSSTHSDTYLFFLPIVTWSWNKLGMDVICFTPFTKKENRGIIEKAVLLEKTRQKNDLKFCIYSFEAPEHKEATYAQCSRLYAAALDLPKYEVLITSDIDMALFEIPQNTGGFITVFGFDLVPPKQVPMCYISADVDELRRIFKINGRTYQQCLDDLLGHIECDHFKGNYWGKDQEEAYNMIFGNNGHAVLLPRAKPGTQFATRRADRDGWPETIPPDIIDAHLPRPGYTEENFVKILKLFQDMYPEENFDWMVEYRNEYVKLIS